MYTCQAVGEDMLEFRGNLRILPTKVVQTGVASRRDMSHPFFLGLSQMTINWIRQITSVAIANFNGHFPNTVSLVGCSIGCERPTKPVAYKSNTILEVYKQKKIQ